MKRPGHDEEALPPLVLEQGVAEPARFSVFKPPSPRPYHVILRLFVWLTAGFRWSLSEITDRLRHRNSPGRSAYRARMLIERLGGGAVPTAMQMAMRLDALPLEAASELARLRDSAPPMDLDYALSRIEAAAGIPIEQLFSTFDPQPVRSDTIQCVYQAVRVNGTQVAVRVRQPLAARQLCTDQAALGWLLRVLELLLPPGRLIVLRQVQDELPQLLLENLDFLRVARLHVMFRKAVRKAKIKKWTASKVFIKLCSEDVLVSRFAAGVPLSEVIAARQSQEPGALAALAELGVDPAECGRRLLHLGWWSFFENYFFCELMDVDNVVVNPGGRLVLDDLGDIGLVSRRERRLLLTIYNRLLEHDVEGTVALVIQLIQPLPLINLHEFTKRLESRMWDQLMAMSNKDAYWWERTSTGLWVALFETTREYGVPIRLNISRMIQSMATHNHIAAQAWPALRVLKEFRRFRKRSERRRGREVVQDWKKRQRKGSIGNVLATLSEGMGTLQRFNIWFDTMVETAPLTFLSMTQKSAYSIAEMLGALGLAAKLTFVAVLAVSTGLWLKSGALDLPAALLLVVRNPVFIVLMVGLVGLTVRRILMRMDDVDRVDD